MIIKNGDMSNDMIRKRYITWMNEDNIEIECFSSDVLHQIEIFII